MGERLPQGTEVWWSRMGGGRAAVVVRDEGGGSVRIRTPVLQVAAEETTYHLVKRSTLRPMHSPGVRAPQRVTRTPDVEGGHRLTAVPKETTWRSRAYLDHVRSYPCCNCGAPPRSEAHHWGPHGMGQKCSDALTAPLCSRCHRFYHDRGALPEADYTRGEDTVETLTRGQLKCLRAWVERREGGGE